MNARPLRVILVEDSDDDLLMLERALVQAGFAPTKAVVCDEQSLRAALREYEWDVVLCDARIPGFAATTALAVVREQGLDLPFIIVSGARSEELALRLMNAGAHDFVSKENLRRLGAAVAREIGSAAVRKQQRETELALERNTELSRGLLASRLVAELASKTKSSFLADMSHELRTPLNAIIGFSELLEQGFAGPLSEKQSSYVGNVLQAGRHLLALVNDILDLSRVEAGKLPLAREWTSLAALTQSIADTVDPLVQRGGVELRIAIDEAVPSLHVDPIRLKQILFNLVSNAIKFTPRGGTVRLLAEARPRAVQIRVEDTGIGIHADDLPRLFNEFERVEAGNGRERADGTGLGLALTKRLVELHGGTIHVASTVGSGTVFTVELPDDRRPIRRSDEAPPSLRSRLHIKRRTLP